MLEHIRKKHPYHHYTDLQLLPFGLVACPTCKTACRGAHGVKTHQAKIHGIKGSSNISTLPRIRAPKSEEPEAAEIVVALPPYPIPPDRAQTAAPGAPRPPPMALTRPPRPPSSAPNQPRKRPARTPSPTLQPRPRRQRTQPTRHHSRVASDSSSSSDWSNPSIATLARRTDAERAKNSTIGGRNSASSTITNPYRAPTSAQQALEEDLYRTADEPTDKEDSPPWPPSDEGPYSDQITSPVTNSTAGHSSQITNSTNSAASYNSQAIELITNSTAGYSGQTANSTNSAPSYSDQATESTANSTDSHSGQTANSTTNLATPGPGNQPTLEQQHYSAIQPTLENPALQALIDFSKMPIPEKRLHARQATLFATTANRVAEAFLRNPREKQLLHFLLLPRVLGLGLEKGQLAATLKAFPTIIPTLDHDPRTNRGPVPDPTKQASRLLEKGYLGRAAKALYNQAPLAPNNAETLAILRQKHPIGSKNPFKGKIRPAAGQPITLEAIIGAISSINREKAPGLSGWSRPLLDLVTAKESPVIALLRLLADMIRQGSAPGASLLCAARLIGLEKPDGGVRPIAIGDLVYRVVTKAILTTLYQPEMLLPSQLGVNSPGGVEPAVFLLEDAIRGDNPYKATKITSVDLKNAFNASSRAVIAGAVARYAPTLYKTATWAYNEPSVLVTPAGDTLASAEGIRQGDPLGPLLFSLGFRPTLEEIQRRLPKVILLAYLDDLYALDPDEKNPTLQKISQVFEGSTLAINLNKSKEYSIRALRAGGLEALGTYIGPRDCRRAFFEQRLNTLEDILSTLREMPRQYAYLLLKGSISLLIRHLLRQLNPIGLEDLWARADDLVRTSIGHLTLRGPSDPIPTLYDDLISLPLREGGLGVTLYTDHDSNLPYTTYTAAKAAARPLMEAIGGNRAPLRARQASPDDLNTPTITAKQALKDAIQVRIQRFQATQPPELQRLRTENSSYLARQWLTALPTRRQLQLPDAEATEAYRARLGVPVRALGLPCTFCGLPATLDHQDVCRGASRRWTSRHDQITRAFIKTLSCRATLQVEEEPPISQDATLRADFAITTENSRYYYDIQVVAIGKESARTDPYSTLTEAAEAKKRKYRGLGPYFRPLIFSAGGLMEKETAKSYKALQALLGPIGSAFLSTSIAIILAKTRAISALSIAKDSPYNDELAWQTTRAALRHRRAAQTAN